MEQKPRLKRKNKVIFVKTDEHFKGEVVCAASVLNHDLSRFTRDALTHYLASLRAQNKAVARALRAYAA